ncbi:hypothetical protein SDRG_05453 [Saprolegnia diclina VS20]|uniref:RCC1-like domain-containing protein n=1 Tax=Saprolegnia diclina (strain VS20) TaxID=1156394 RepID=T0RX94_SAPDV|nr:hypothetical protein SDRG_05453 [Saprolegnia diclina VS20]EQC37228.1 hypothetical protein SDRG_05453 [Saprolegnia diclina VS20]|eukprot:XP_008609390.1 hypothetical protein SDRG_05453 [Saprolegnia diclina VS20]
MKRRPPPKSEQAKRAFLRRLGSEITKESNVVQDAWSPGHNFYSTTEVRSWGSGSHGQLGLGDDRHRLAPEIVLELYRISTDHRKLQLSCSELFTVAVNDEGHVYLWGRPPTDSTLPTTAKVPERVPGLDSIAIQSVASGSGHIVLLSATGAVYTWGKGGSGRLGHGDEHSVTVPKHVQHMPTTAAIHQVACGAEHTLVLDATGRAFGFGSNRAGQLGTGSYCNSNEPALVASAVRFASIVCGMNHSGAVSLDHAVYTWGWGEKGRLGLGSDASAHTPTRIETLRDVKLLSFGGAHSLALTHSRKVYAWGWGAFGQLGLGHCSDSSVPKRIKSLDDIEQIACGFGHSAAVSFGGRLYLWGFGEEGQLGTGDEGNRDVPQLVWTHKSGTATDPPKVLQIALGKVHSIGIAELSMSASQRAKLNPDTIRTAAKRIQRTVRHFLRRTRVRRRHAAYALERQTQYERERTEASRQLLAEEEARRKRDEQVKCDALQAVAVAKRERKLLEARLTVATRLQAVVRGTRARAKCAALRARARAAMLEARAVEAAATRACFCADALAAYTEQTVAYLSTELVKRIHVEAFAAIDASVQLSWITAANDAASEASALAAREAEAAAKAARLESEKRDRETRRLEAAAAAEAAHRQRRDKEIADAKAKAKAKTKVVDAVVAPRKDKRRLNEAQLRKVAAALNASREDRDKTRQELIEQKRLLDVQEHEKALLAAKADAEKRERLFRKSLTHAPYVRGSLSSSVRALHIAETYRVLPGDIKPHYVLDESVMDPATSLPTEDGSRSTSKYRIFRDIRRPSIHGLKSPRDEPNQRS